jgi:hypothetical protein
MHLHACMHDAELHLHACMHDAELHGHLGLLMHAQLAAGHVAPRCEGRRCEVDARLRKPGARGRAWALPVGRDRRARGHAMPFEIDARAWTEQIAPW